MSVAITYPVTFTVKSSDGKEVSSFKFYHDSPIEMHATYRELSCRFLPYKECSVKQDWKWKQIWAGTVGTFVPLCISYYLGDEPISCLIRFTDRSYIRHYSDNLNFGAVLRGDLDGWAVPNDLQKEDEAIHFVDTHNKDKIPQSDTFEWDAWYEPSQNKVYFFPMIPKEKGHPESGDLWCKTAGVWDDVVRAFVFSPKEWDECMGFYGFSVDA